MLPSWANDTITVIEPTWRDDRGTETADYDNPSSVTVVPGCSVQPGASTEDLMGRTNVIVRHTVYAPPGTVINAHAAVEYDGTRYAVDGQPARWPSPTGAVSNVVLLLVDWEG